MKRNRHEKPRDSRYISKLDDYELKLHNEFDPRKAKPNRFAGRVKLSHGGARPGSGRKPAPEPVERHTITLYKRHAMFLRSLDVNISRAIRKLIAKAK